MARREANDQRILRQYWGTQPLTHKQCLVNILTRLTAGDVNLGAIGLPPHPGRENFTWKPLSKYVSTCISVPYNTWTVRRQYVQNDGSNK